MDERRGRRAAKGLGLRHVGLLGILAEAKRRGFVPAVRPLLDLLVTRAGFWVSRELYARVLHETGE
jgi:predicted nucleic acid-binding protein